MGVMIGSARIDERGKASGGKAGDQTGKEVSTQSWYKHSKGWRVIRAKDPDMRVLQADAMESACRNNNIGYDQGENKTLWNLVDDRGWDPAKADKPCETDCARLVRVCAQYAVNKLGYDITIPDFYTADMANKLLKTGLYEEKKGSAYTDSSNRLCRGDILVTCTKGHTVIVLNDGPNSENYIPEKEYELGERILKNGDTGKDVKEMQTLLIQAGYDCGKWGADGEFGDSTEMAVRTFQSENFCDVDGEFGPQSYNTLLNLIGDDTADREYVQIVGGNCFIRDQPNTNGKVLNVAYAGNVFDLLEVSTNGWCRIEYPDDNVGWVSGKYSRIQDHK